MKYGIKLSKQYRKDIKRLIRSNRDLEPLEALINLLAGGKKIPEKYRDHALKGKLVGSRECHIAPDWILRYVKEEDCLLLLLISTGDHRQVLGIE